jgi:hypothetical protein
MTSKAPMSSMIASASTNIRRLSGTRLPSKAKLPATNAMSVAMTTPHWKKLGFSQSRLASHRVPNDFDHYEIDAIRCTLSRIGSLLYALSER